MEQSYNLGVLFADDSNYGLTHNYFASILDSFKRTAESKGYDISFLNCCKDAENRKTYLEQAKYRKYDGIVIACIDYGNPEVKELLDSSIPIVTIDQRMDNVVSIESDNENGIRELVRYLHEMGHKRIAYITGDDNVVTAIRLKGFRESCEELGIQVPEEYIRSSEYRNMKKASYQTEQLMRLENPPSCILYSDDFAAIGGINTLHARGFEIPADISIAGYDGIHILSQYQPRLTTIKQNTIKIGRLAAEKLIECIEQSVKMEGEAFIVETELEKGKTVGRVFY